MPDEIKINLFYPLLVFVISSILVFIFVKLKTRLYNALKSISEKKPNKEIPVSLANNYLILEAKDKGSLYRARDTNNAYLVYNVLVANANNELFIIRNFEIRVNNALGTFMSKKISIKATHSGVLANYSIGISENILPLALPPNTSKEFYLGFAFLDKNLKIGVVEMKVFTSKGDVIVSLPNEIID